MSEEKIKLAIIPAASCGGCDVSLANLNEKLLELTKFVDIVFWPTVTDFKIEDLENLEGIDIALFIGSIRLKDHEEKLKLAREKAKILVAYGACACFGGIFSLGNLFDSEELLEHVYLSNELITTDNTEKEIPGQKYEINGLDLNITPLTDLARPLNDFVKVDIYAPGCPPREIVLDMLVEVISNYIQTRQTLKIPLVLAKDTPMCNSCPRIKPEKISIDKFRRIGHEPIQQDLCFLAQGIICLGLITRDGCGLPCIKANMPCRGCFGPTSDIIDPGGKFASAFAPLFKLGAEKALSDKELIEVVEKIDDPIGYAYRFTLGMSLLKKIIREIKEGRKNESDTN